MLETITFWIFDWVLYSFYFCLIYAFLRPNSIWCPSFILTCLIVHVICCPQFSFPQKTCTTDIFALFSVLVHLSICLLVPVWYNIHFLASAWFWALVYSSSSFNPGPWLRSFPVPSINLCDRSWREPKALNPPRFRLSLSRCTNKCTDLCTCTFYAREKKCQEEVAKLPFYVNNSADTKRGDY